jgi:hypothetical protein
MLCLHFLSALQIPSRGLTVDYASCMVFVPGANEVWCGLSSGGVCTYKNRALAQESDDGHLGPVTCMAWSERAKLMWTGGGDGKLICWSAAEKRRVGTLEGHADWVRCLLVCNGRLWSGSDDKTIRVWNESGATPQHFAQMTVHRGSVLCLAVVGDEVWSGSADRQICRFDKSGTELGYLVGHKGRVMAFGVGQKSCWAGCSDRRCVIWAVRAHGQMHQPIGGFSGSVGALALVDGWCMWTGTGDGAIRCWQAEEPPADAVFPGRAAPIASLVAAAATTAVEDAEILRSSSGDEQQQQQEEEVVEEPALVPRPRRQKKLESSAQLPSTQRRPSPRSLRLNLDSQLASPLESPIGKHRESRAATSSRQRDKESPAQPITPTGVRRNDSHRSNSAAVPLQNPAGGSPPSSSVRRQDSHRDSVRPSRAGDSPSSPTLRRHGSHPTTGVSQNHAGGAPLHGSSARPRPVTPDSPEAQYLERPSRPRPAAPPPASPTVPDPQHYPLGHQTFGESALGMPAGYPAPQPWLGPSRQPWYQEQNSYIPFMCATLFGLSITILSR